MNSKILLGGLLLIGIVSFGTYQYLNSKEYLYNKAVKGCKMDKNPITCECALKNVEDYLEKDVYIDLLRAKIEKDRIKIGKISDSLSFREIVELGQIIEVCEKELKERGK